MEACVTENAQSSSVRRLSDMEPVLARIASYEFGQTQDPLCEFTAFLRDAMGSANQLPQIEARLIKMLGPGTTIAGKDYACRQLSLIGTSACVPALAGMLSEVATAGIARYALARIPAPIAADALRSALPKSSGKERVGIIDALAERRDARSAAPLKALLSSSDDQVSGAAFAALARIGDAPALSAISAARDGLRGPRRERASAALLRCADAMAASGDITAATRAYRRLAASEEPEMIRIGALHGLASTEGKAALPLLSRELGSPAAQVQAAAIQLLNEMPGADVTALLVKSFPNLSALGQIRVLAALARRGDAGGARLVVTKALESSTPEVRSEALSALGKVGDASSVPVLADAAANAEGPAQSAARTSLSELHGAGVEAALVSAIGTAEGRVQLELIRAAGDRGSTGAADALMRIARGADRDASRESIRALRTVAGPVHSEPMLDLVLNLRTAADRRDAAVTLASVIRRSDKASISPVLAAYRSSADVETRALLLDVMGQVSATDALPVLRAALKDPAAEIARAAILALTAWQTPDPLADLFAVARGDSNATRQILAVRGLVKLIQAPSDRSAEETVKLLSEVMLLAKQPQERRSILSVLPNYPVKASLALAEAASKDAAVAREAKAAIDQLKGVLPQ
jgi:HEAT repeat protein